jgi:galactokinase
MIPLRTRADALADQFQHRFGRAPESVWFAPGRVNLIGDHTDYNLGFSLPFAVHFGVLCAGARRDDTIIRSASLQFTNETHEDLALLQPGIIDSWHSYVVGSAYGMREHGVAPGLDLLFDGDIPPGAGMSSSAALSCATALIINDLGEGSLSLNELALVAQASEHRFAGTPCGLLDQTASLLATQGHALLVDFRSMSNEQVPLDPADHDAALVVIDTRAPHRLVDSEYASRRAACESAAAELGVTSLRDVTDVSHINTLDETRARRVRHVITENQRVKDTVALLNAGRTVDIGPVLTASHASLRDDFEVTVPELDVAVEAALASGALGARMTGGGFGGSVIALVPTAARIAMETAVRQAYAEHHFTAPHFVDVRPSPGAHQVN